MLIMLGEIGLGANICKEYEVARDDLDLLAFVESECRQLQKEIDEEQRGRREEIK